METNETRALIYLRVSTDRQVQKGISLPTQEGQCLAHASAHGYLVDPKGDVYIDGGETGTTMERRSALMDLLSRCQKDRNVRAVIVYDISRLARNRIEFALIKVGLKKNGAVLLSATEPIDETPEGQMLEGVLSTVAEFFSAQNARKVRANMIRKAETGGWPNIAPYGYRNRKEKFPDGSIRAWIEPNPEEARWVKRAFELYAKGLYSVKVLTSVLNKEGFTGRVARHRSRFLHHSHLDRMLRNKIYIGVIEWGGVVNEHGTHETLIDPDLFYRVQDLLRGRSSSVTRQRRHRSLFKQIAFCAECGSAMTIDVKEASATRAIRYLRCRKVQKGKPVSCTQRYFAEEYYALEFQKLLERVELPEGAVLDLRKKLEALTSEDKQVYEQAKEKLETELQGVRVRHENLLIRSLEDDPRDETQRSLYERVKGTLTDEERRLSRELGRLAQRLSRIGRIIMMALDIAGLCSRVFTADVDPNYQGLLGRVIFKEVRVKEGMIVGATLDTVIAFFRKWAGEKPLEMLSDLALLCAPDANLVDGINSCHRGPASLSEIKEDLLRLQELLTPEEEAEIESCYYELCGRGILPHSAHKDR